MARLSGALCMVLVTSSLLLMVLLAAGPTSAYVVGPPSLDGYCYRNMMKCLRRACKCGWPLDWAAAECGHNNLLAKGYVEPNWWSDNDDKEDKKDPRCPGGNIPAREQMIHIPNICEMVKRSAFSLLPPGYSEEEYHFNHDGCAHLLADMCNIVPSYKLGYTTMQFGRMRQLAPAAHSSCKSCKSMAKMLARMICSPEHCFCDPKHGGDIIGTVPVVVRDLATLSLSKFAPIENFYFVEKTTKPAQSILGCHCIPPPPPCKDQGGYLDEKAVTASAAADVAAGK